LVDADGRLGRRLFDLLRAHGRKGRNLAELGIGTNDRATLSGNVLEDCKLLGSVHVGFGASAAIGGTVQTAVHLDAVVIDASLWIDGRQILDGGRLMVADPP
jgi:leucyl aminopeptidase (aminopeptidase T)